LVRTTTDDQVEVCGMLTLTVAVVMSRPAGCCYMKVWSLAWEKGVDSCSYKSGLWEEVFLVCFPCYGDEYFPRKVGGGDFFCLVLSRRLSRFSWDGTQNRIQSGGLHRGSIVQLMFEVCAVSSLFPVYFGFATIHAAPQVLLLLVSRTTTLETELSVQLDVESGTICRRTAGLVVQLFQAVAEDVLIWSVGPKHSVNPFLTAL